MLNICIPETSAVTNMPEALSFEEAASIPYSGTLALFFLQKATIKKGQNVLIYVASGAIGTSAIQIAKYYGAVVDGVCWKTNLELVKGLGADSVIDYTGKYFKLENGRFDLIFDAVEKKKRAGLKDKKALKPGGSLFP